MAASSPLRPPADALRACGIFASMPDDELRSLAEASSARRYAPGQVVFLQGDPGEHLYVIRSGAVDVVVQDPNGASTLLAVLEPPEAFGELAVVDGAPRSATAVARGRLDVLAVPGPQVRRVLREHPEVGTAMLLSLTRLVRRLDEHTSALSVHDLPYRVHQHLAGIALRQAGRAADDIDPAAVLPVELSLSQSDLARQVGGSRQQVNKVLALLEGAGAIERSGHRVTGVRVHAFAEPT